MGDLRNCPTCGKVFVKINRNLCPECMEKEEKDYDLARKYLKDNPRASVREISELTGIDGKKILRWIREGRIDVDYAGAGSGLTCKRCGTKISIGNLCSNCIKLLSGQMKSISPSAPSTPTEDPSKAKDSKTKRMFVAERIRDGE